MNNKVIAAGDALEDRYDAFNKEITLTQLFLYQRFLEACAKAHDPDK